MISTNYNVIAFKANENDSKGNVSEAKEKITGLFKQGAPLSSSNITDKFVKDATEPSKDGKSGLKIGNIIGGTIDTWQNFLKFKARTVEYTKGVVTGAVAGLGIGGAVMSLDWAMNSVSRVARGNEKASIYITEPAKVIGSAFSGVFKGVYHLPNMTIKNILKKTLHSPIDLFCYVKNAKHVTKAGKVLAPVAGGVALAYCLTRAVLRANQRVADIEHAFSSGHAHDLR